MFLFYALKDTGGSVPKQGRKILSVIKVWIKSQIAGNNLNGQSQKFTDAYVSAAHQPSKTSFDKLIAICISYIQSENP